MTRRPERFAPVPNRAAGDDRLTGLHYRVLLAIAMHARFGDNGLGCTLSSGRLAHKIGSLQHKVAVARRQLVEWGYLEEFPHPARKQMFMHLVKFDLDADSAILSVKTDTSQGIGGDDEPIPHGVSGSSETDTSQGITEDSTLKSREYNLVNQTENIPLGRGVSPDGEPRQQDERGISISARLAMLERRLPDLAGEDRDDIMQTYRWLIDVAEQHESHNGDPIGGRAQRLAEELGWILEEKGATA